MMTLLIKSYASILLMVGLFSLFIFITGLYFILRKKKQSASFQEQPEKVEMTLNENSNADLDTKLINPITQKNPRAATITRSLAKVHEELSQNRSTITITSNDITAISGGDVIATQLDLARAYIETGRKQLAKKILAYVVDKGDETQQTEAKILLGYL